MPPLLSNLLPAKNLNYGILGAVITIVFMTLVKKYLGIDLPQQLQSIAVTYEPTATPLTVTVELAGIVGYAISHCVDVWDNFKNPPVK